MGDLVHLHTRTEPWLTKRQLSGYLGRSVRWVEARTQEGLPSRLLAGRRQYRVSECETWLREHGHLEDAS